MPDSIGPLSTNPIPTITSRAYGGFGDDTPASTQGRPAPGALSLGYGQPLIQPSSTPHENPASIAPVPRSSTQTTGRELRRSQRSTRAYDPVRGREGNRSRRKRGRGRTRGTPNYKDREVEMLLDLAEEELPIASNGWRVVGARFRDWATVTQNPARTDQSLELKFKQVSLPS